MEYDIETVEALGIKVFDKSVDFFMSEESKSRIEEILENEGGTADEILIGIHPGGMSSRRWPIENFAAIINTLTERLPCRFLITGSQSEKALAKQLVQKAKGPCLDLSGRLSIPETGAAIEKCRVFISNDTGPMHMAAILKVPLVAIFGPGDITRFDPRNMTDDVRVLYKGAECAPCERVNCDDLRCLKIINPEEVVRSVVELVNYKKTC